MLGRSLVPCFGPVCSPFTVNRSIERALRGPRAGGLTLHTGNTPGKSARPASLRHCAAITLSEQSSASARLAVQPVSDAALGGWDDEPAATFDSACTLVAIGHSRERGCWLAHCL